MQSAILKQVKGILNHEHLKNDVLLWLRNMTQGVSVYGVTEFAPSTLEIIGISLDASPNFLRTRITRVLEAESTVQDRPH